MGVFAINEEGNVWGASNSFCYHLIEFFITEAGRKRFLTDMKMAFDHGYNSVSLHELSDENYREVKRLVLAYLQNEAYLALEYPAIEMEDSLRDFINRLEHGRSKHPRH